jgi:DNA-binding MarR family transcriptional regulator
MQFELQNFLPYRLSLLTNTVSQGIASAYRDRFGISITEWRILAVLGRYPELTASEVAERTAMDKVSISRAVKTLKEKGLLERTTDSGDRRRRRLRLTRDKGMPVLEKIIPQAADFEDHLLQALDQQEIEAFLRTLDKLQKKASEIAPPRDSKIKRSQE